MHTQQFLFLCWSFFLTVCRLEYIMFWAGNVDHLVEVCPKDTVYGV